MIAKSSYVKGNLKQAASRLNAHLKYVQYRKGEERRDFFSTKQDGITRHQVHADVMKHASPGVCYHKLILSPADDEPVSDWQRWTRNVMKDLEAYQGKQLHWYATIHTNTDHHHVHIVIAGLATNEAGKTASVALYAKERARDAIGDFEILMQSGHTHSDYEYHQYIQDVVRNLDAVPDDTTQITLDQPGQQEIDV